MIKNFGNKMASDLFHTGESKKLPRQFWRRVVHLLDVMEAVDSLEDLKKLGFPPNVRLHQLSGKRKGQWAIDIHKLSGWRIIFKFGSNEFVEVCVEDYH